MGNEDNLVPLTTDRAREIGSLGGKKAAETKRRRKQMKDDLLALLKTNISNPKTGETATTQEVILANFLDKVIKRPSFKDLEFIRDTIGEKPEDKPQINQQPIVIDLGNLTKNE